jgi:2-dehydropantoate 2-reductase
VGSYFGGMLARAGATVTFIGRPGSTSPHLARIRERGLEIDGVEVKETVDVGVGETPEVAAAGVVLFAVKTLDTESAAEAMRPHLAGGAIVVSLQNGVDNVERMAGVGVRAIPAVVIVAAAIDAPGVVKHRGRGDLVIGDAEQPEAASSVAKLFGRAGVQCAISDDIRKQLWSKLVINSMANATSALTRASYRALAEFEPTWKISLDVAREAAAVAAAEGVQLDVDKLVAHSLAIMEDIGQATSSTEQDIAHGRRTEIDSLNGYVARRGAELGVATPANEMLWALLKLRERS